MGVLRCCVAMAALGAISVVDIRDRRIPNMLVAFLLLSDWAFAAFSLGFGRELAGRLASLALGGLATLLLLLAFDAAARRVLHGQGIGGGDIKLIAAFAAMDATVGLGAVLLAASVLGASYALLRGLSLKDSFPFGPFLAAGYVIGNALVASGM